jgi:dGTPase
MIETLRIRDFTEDKEESLSPCAVKSKNSKGRQRPEEPDPIRTAFQRDRDRIIHCNSFRRLKHKTQVFIAPLGDHYVTRLTHTLEVSQIARTIARALNLNEDLTEAISLGHDLGHTPFGHLGEDTLNELYAKGFRHNEQSLRIVDRLEKDGKGLNLTWEVRDGIVHHSKSSNSILGEKWGKVGTLEGEIVKISDMVAYINHDIGDAVRAGVLTEKDLPLEAIKVLGNNKTIRINTMVTDIIQNSWEARTCDKIKKSLIKMSPRVLSAANLLRDFLFERVYTPSTKNEDAVNAKKTVVLLWEYFVSHENRLPAEYRFHADTVERGVADYIASMTDQYALRLAEELGKEK